MVSYLLRSKSNDIKEITAGFYAEKDNTLDMVFIGSSAIYRYAVPPLIWNESGLTSYVLATPGQQFSLTPSIIRECEKSQNPSLYIIEVRRLISEDVAIKKGQVEEDPETRKIYLQLLTDNLLYSLNRYFLIEDAVEEKDKTAWHIDIIRNHSDWKELSLSSFSLMFYHKKHALKSARTLDTVQPQVMWDTTAYKDKKLALEDETEAKLIKVLKYCRDNGCHVLFVSTPYVSDELSIAEENYIGDIIKSYGFDYLNCNYYYDEIGMDFNTNFYNNRHANVLGAENVTRFLASYIAMHYDIKTNHSDSIASEWNKAYKIWSSLAKKQEATVMKES